MDGGTRTAYTLAQLRDWYLPKRQLHEGLDDRNPLEVWTMFHLRDAKFTKIYLKIHVLFIPNAPYAEETYNASVQTFMM